MEPFLTPYGELNLERVPPAGNQPLRAWDAADELLLDTLSAEQLTAPGSNILLLNDQFAALSCALQQFSRTLYSDSFLTQLALEQNQQRNNIVTTARFLPSIHQPSERYDLVVIKIPKTLALLEQQLATLRPIVRESTKIIAGGMVKYLQKSHFACFERYLGPVSSSLAKKKARLIFVDALHAEEHASPYPSSYIDPSSGLMLSNHANVFSRSKPDWGSQLMISHFDRLQTAKHIIDMGCGNGILGINLKRQRPDVQTIRFVDESFMALESSRSNYSSAFGNTEGAEFIPSNCFQQLAADSADLILCNPPFHQANTVGDHIAWSMISEGRDCLQRGGTLCLVGNRHLNYHSKIKHVFGNVELLASDSKFVLLAARKT